MRISDWSSDVCSSDLVCGLCLTAGLLQARGYPEIIARVLRGALIGHDHRLNANIIQKMVDGSTAITMPANLAGATAPLLTPIELPVQHLRTLNRMDPRPTLQAVFPMWVDGVVRPDLALRLGLAALPVSTHRINHRLTLRGIP